MSKAENVAATKHGAPILSLEDGWVVLPGQVGHYFRCRDTQFGLFGASLCGHFSGLMGDAYEIGVETQCQICADRLFSKDEEPPEDWKEVLLGGLTVTGVQLGGPHEKANAQHISTRLARCDKRDTAMLLAKYAFDEKSVHSLWAYWFEFLMSKGWETHKPKVIEGMASATLHDHLAPNRCGSCQGAGYLDPMNERLCDMCFGSGLKFLSGRAVARKMGFGRGVLRDPWKSRVHWARSELWKWEVRALSRMR